MITDTEARVALDQIEARIHDCGTHALAACAALAITESPEVSMRSIWRARSILRAIGREVK